MQKILLIQPDLALGGRLTFILEHSGFQVVNTTSGQQALVRMHRRCPDLIVLAEDAHSLNGNELCVRIRELCQAPIIVLGREREEAAGVGLLEMGANAYLTSPLNSKELLARVRSLLGRRQADATEP